MAGQPKTRAKRRQKNREAKAARPKETYNTSGLRPYTSETGRAAAKLSNANRTPESYQVHRARRNNYVVFPNVTDEQLEAAEERIAERERLEALGVVEPLAKWTGPRTYTLEMVEALALDMVEYYESHPDCRLLVTWCNEKRIVRTRIAAMAKESVVFAEALELVKQFQEERILKGAMEEETLEPGVAKMFLQAHYPWYRESWRGLAMEAGSQAEGVMLPATADGCAKQIKMLEERQNQLTELMERARSLPSAIVTT